MQETQAPSSRPPRASVSDPQVPPAEPVEDQAPSNVSGLDRASRKAMQRSQQTQAELAVKLSAMRDMAIGAQEVAKRACSVLEVFLKGQQEVNSYKIDGAEVIVIRHAGSLQFNAAIVNEIAGVFKKPVITMVEGSELMGLNAEQMEKAGWVRKIQIVAAT